MSKGILERGPEACRLGLLLLGSGASGHTELSGDYTLGQLSLAFLSSESHTFSLPIFGADLVAGQLSRVRLQEEAAPSSLPLLLGAKMFCPLQGSLSCLGPRDTFRDELLGRELMLFFLLVPKRRILSQMFLQLENIFAIALRRLPLPTPPFPGNFLP